MSGPSRLKLICKSAQLLIPHFVPPGWCRQQHIDQSDKGNFKINFIYLFCKLMGEFKFLSSPPLSFLSGRTRAAWSAWFERRSRSARTESECLILYATSEAHWSRPPTILVETYKVSYKSDILSPLTV